MDIMLVPTFSCGTRCKTCNTWMFHGTMPVDQFRELWHRLNDEPEVERLVMNTLGDVNTLENAEEYLHIIDEYHKRPVVFTTNAKCIPFVPRVDAYICSFNGGTKESYENTTGLNFEEVQATIRSHYEDFRARVHDPQIHMVVWSGNKGTEKQFGELWADFPGRVRLNYRRTNIPEQWASEEEKRAPKKRIFCENMDNITIFPDGTCQICTCGISTDLKDPQTYGNVFSNSLFELLNHPMRLRLQAEETKGIYSGACAKCDFNTPIEGKIVFLK